MKSRFDEKLLHRLAFVSKFLAPFHYFICALPQFINSPFLIPPSNGTAHFVHFD